MTELTTSSRLKSFADDINFAGLGYSIVAVTCYSFTQPIVKMIYMKEPLITAYEVLYWKSLSMILFNYVFCRYIHGVFPLDIPKEYQNIIVFRGFVGFIGISGMFGSV